MIKILELEKEQYSGKPFTLQYTTQGYYHIETTAKGFEFHYKKLSKSMTKSFSDVFFADWLNEPKAFAAIEDDRLIGYVEGALEEWNNRYRISNIAIFDETNRHKGIGGLLMDAILKEAIQSKARMVVLETQTCNEKAIHFYQKHGFNIIGFDLYAYSNHDAENHEIRLEMGKILETKHERIIDKEISLIPYYPNYQTALSWYQDPEACRQVDNRDTPYDLKRLKAMYSYLNQHGDLFYIEYQKQCCGDVCLQKNGEINIFIAKPFQNKHIGRKVIAEIIRLAKEKKQPRLYATIYAFNKQSQKMFESAGFSKIDHESYILQLSQN